MGVISRIKDELTKGHDVTGAYNADDQLATDEMNAFNLDTEGSIAGLREYLIKNRARTNQGDDTIASSLYGRLLAVAEGVQAGDPFGRNDPPGTYPNGLLISEIHAAKMLVEMLKTGTIQDQFDFLDTEFEAALDAMTGNAKAGVWKTADKDSIRALSQNKTNAAQVYVGVTLVKVGQVTDARAS